MLESDALVAEGARIVLAWLYRIWITKRGHSQHIAKVVETVVIHEDI